MSFKQKAKKGAKLLARRFATITGIKIHKKIKWVKKSSEDKKEENKSSEILRTELTPLSNANIGNTSEDNTFAFLNISDSDSLPVNNELISQELNDDKLEISDNDVSSDQVSDPINNNPANDIFIDDSGNYVDEQSAFTGELDCQSSLDVENDDYNKQGHCNSEDIENKPLEPHTIPFSPDIYKNPLSKNEKTTDHPLPVVNKKNKRESDFIQKCESFVLGNKKNHDFNSEGVDMKKIKVELDNWEIGCDKEILKNNQDDREKMIYNKHAASNLSDESFNSNDDKIKNIDSAINSNSNIIQNSDGLLSTGYDLININKKSMVEIHNLPPCKQKTLQEAESNSDLFFFSPKSLSHFREKMEIAFQKDKADRKEKGITKNKLSESSVDKLIVRDLAQSSADSSDKSTLDSSNTLGTSNDADEYGVSKNFIPEIKKINSQIISENNLKQNMDGFETRSQFNSDGKSTSINSKTFCYENEKITGCSEFPEHIKKITKNKHTMMCRKNAFKEYPLENLKFEQNKVYGSNKAGCKENTIGVDKEKCGNDEKRKAGNTKQTIFAENKSSKPFPDKQKTENTAVPIRRKKLPQDIVRPTYSKRHLEAREAILKFRKRRNACEIIWSILRFPFTCCYPDENNVEVNPLVCDMIEHIEKYYACEPHLFNCPFIGNDNPNLLKALIEGHRVDLTAFRPESIVCAIKRYIRYTLDGLLDKEISEIILQLVRMERKDINEIIKKNIKLTMRKDKLILFCRLMELLLIINEHFNYSKTGYYQLVNEMAIYILPESVYLKNSYGCILKTARIMFAPFDFEKIKKLIDLKK